MLPPNDAASPRVTVIIPAYNAAPYLATALHSVLAQTFHDFEVVVVDDGSTDDTFQVAAGFAGRDGRFRVIRQENRGIGGARNTALRVARGEWVALLDSDDAWFPDYLAEQMAILQQRPELDVLSANAINLGGELDGQPYKPPSGPLVELSLLDLVRTEDAVCILSVFRRRLLHDVGLFDETLRGSEDYDFWLRAAARRARIAFNPMPLAQYRRRPDSVSADETLMLEAIVVPLRRIREGMEHDDVVRRAVDEQLARFARRRMIVAARRALLARDLHGLTAQLNLLYASTGEWQYRVARWLSTALPSSLIWLYACKGFWVRHLARRGKSRPVAGWYRRHAAGGDLVMTMNERDSRVP